MEEAAARAQSLFDSSQPDEVNLGSLDYARLIEELQSVIAADDPPRLPRVSEPQDEQAGGRRHDAERGGAQAELVSPDDMERPTPPWRKRVL